MEAIQIICIAHLQTVKNDQSLSPDDERTVKVDTTNTIQTAAKIARVQLHVAMDSCGNRIAADRSGMKIG
jgi:hypothetical protein